MKRILHHPHVRKHVRQGSKFIVSGLIGAVLEFSIIRVMVGHYGISPFITYIPSGVIPSVFVFLFNKHVTFRGAKGKTSGQTMRFIAVYTLAFCINYALSAAFYATGMQLVLGANLLGIIITRTHIAYAAKVLAIGLTAFWNYSFSNAFIFKHSVQPEAAVAASAAL